MYRSPVGRSLDPMTLHRGERMPITLQRNNDRRRRGIDRGFDGGVVVGVGGGRVGRNRGVQGGRKNPPVRDGGGCSRWA